jgi:phage shock protein PspC (stress-responsive transcriptional regulator)
MKAMRLQNQWTRSTDGWLAGVCQGLGEQFDINPAMLRLIWFLSVLFFGVGLIFYFICAFIMPVQGKEERAQEPKFFGVCLRLSERLDIDVVPLRIVTIVLALGSFGTVTLAYFLLHFVIPKSTESQHSSKL